MTMLNPVSTAYVNSLRLACSKGPQSDSILSCKAKPTLDMLIYNEEKINSKFALSEYNQYFHSNNFKIVRLNWNYIFLYFFLYFFTRKFAEKTKIQELEAIFPNVVHIMAHREVVRS